MIIYVYWLLITILLFIGLFLYNKFNKHSIKYIEFNYEYLNNYFGNNKKFIKCKKRFIVSLYNNIYYTDIIISKYDEKIIIKDYEVKNQIKVLNISDKTLQIFLKDLLSNSYTTRCISNNVKCLKENLITSFSYISDNHFRKNPYNKNCMKSDKYRNIIDTINKNKLMNIFNIILIIDDLYLQQIIKKLIKKYYIELIDSHISYSRIKYYQFSDYVLVFRNIDKIIEKKKINILFSIIKNNKNIIILTVDSDNKSYYKTTYSIKKILKKHPETIIL